MRQDFGGKQEAMRLLILGGTVFLGRHLVEAAQRQGHEVTLFNRGRHNPDLFPDVEKLRGDRDGGLGVLTGGRWDAVIDTCGYVPRVVQASANLLATAVKHYTFISTISVYESASQRYIDEDSPVGRLADPSIEDVTGESYGPLKALCEQAAEAAMPGRALIVRPGLIVGPHDPTDRFTYWPHRIAQGGQVLAPGNPEAPVQIIDVRDLAEWLVRMIAAGETGTFNATGPEQPYTMARFLDKCHDAVESDAQLVWVGQDFLLEQGVEPWSEVPLWLGGEEEGLLAVSVEKATGRGLTFRPLAETVRATLAWSRTRPGDHEWRAGLDRDKEKSLLKAWAEFGNG